MALTQRKPIGGLRSALIFFLNGAAPCSVPLAENRSTYTEEILSDDGVLRVHHTLTLVVPHNEASRLIILSPSMVADGVFAEITTEAGERLAVGSSDSFRNEQPLRLTSFVLSAGTRPADGNDVVLRLESDDTTALQEV